MARPTLALRKDEILRGRTAFRKLLRNGQRFNEKGFSLFFYPPPEDASQLWSQSVKSGVLSPGITPAADCESSIAATGSFSRRKRKSWLSSKRLLKVGIISSGKSKKYSNKSRKADKTMVLRVRACGCRLLQAALA